MIKQKAPKDMTAVEFVEYLIARKKDEKVLDVNVYYTLEFLKGRLNEPAQNPFTPDQLAWMRETQRSGYCFVAMDTGGNIWCYATKPFKSFDSWEEKEPDRFPIEITQFMFFDKFLSWDDPEPICFADYAPLEEKK